MCAGAVRRLPVTSVGTGSLQAQALRFVEKDVLRKRKEPHCWGSEGAMGFEEDFVLAVRPVSRDCIGFWQ